MDGKLYFLDSNTFYYFCHIYDSPVNVDGAGRNGSVNYGRLKAFFDQVLSNESNDMIGISPAVLLEITGHFKNDPQTLDSLFQWFLGVFGNRGAAIGYQSYEPFMLDADKNGKSIFKSILAGDLPSIFIGDALINKLHSEARLILVFVFNVYMSFILFFFLKNLGKYFVSLTPELGHKFASLYSSAMKGPLEASILSDLQVAYSENLEKGLVNRNFESYLSRCSSAVIAAFEVMKNEGILQSEAFAEIISVLGNGNNLISKLRNWYLHNGGRDLADIGEPKKVKVVDYTLKLLKANIECQGYSAAQAEYVASIIYDFYERGRLVKKNDTEDFWLLYLTSKGYLISYDDRVREIIRKANPLNADFINGVSNKRL